MKILHLTTMLSLMILVAACSPVADEIVDYTNDEMLTHNEYEEEFQQMMQEFPVETATQQEVYESLAGETQEQVEEHFEFVESVDLDHEETQELHQLLINSVEYRYESLQTEITAMEENNPALVEESNQYLDASEEKQVEFNERLDELVEEYDLEYVQE